MEAWRWAEIYEKPNDVNQTRSVELSSGMLSFVLTAHIAKRYVW